MRLLILLCFLPLSLLGQNGLETAILETETGGIIVFTDTETSFTIELDTAKIQPMDSEEAIFMNIDEKWILQLFTLDFQTSTDTDMSDTEEQKSAIFKYVDYEIKYLQNEVELSLENIQIKSGIINDRTFVLWYFDTPEYPTVEKQIYLTTICNDYFLNMNVPLTDDLTLNEGINFLQEIGENIQIYDNPTDIEKLYYEINGL